MSHAAPVRRLLQRVGVSPAGGGEAPPGKYWWVRWVVLSLVAIVLVVELALGWDQLAKAWTSVYEANWWWLLAAVLAAAAAVHSFAQIQRTLLKSAGVNVKQLRSEAAFYAANSLSTTLPGGPVLSATFLLRQQRIWGASTAEAQDRAGTDVAESVRLALAGEFVPDAVNVDGGVVNEEVAPWLDLVCKLGVLVAALSDELPASLSVHVRGELASEDVEILRLSALRGLFSTVIEDAVTFVNAPALAAERGVSAEITTGSESPNHRSVVDVRAVASDGSVVNIAGTLSGPQLVQKIVQVNGRNFDLRAQGMNLVIRYVDQPGALGKIGTLLGAAGVNIQAAQLSEDTEGPGATILLRLDQDVPGDVRSAIVAAVSANKLEVVNLS